MENMKNCRCPHHSLVGVCIALIALTILGNHVGMLSDGTAGIIWPVLLGLIGLQKAFSRMCKCCSSSDCACKCCEGSSPSVGKCC